MKMPEFIPFHFDKFTRNLSVKHGPAGLGRWMLLKKSVAETETLSLNINDPIERETLELDTQCTAQELSDLLDYSAQRGMIDANLYATGIIWIEKLDEDLGPFFRAGKRKIPQRPATFRKNSETSAQLSEKFQEMLPPIGIPEHEHAHGTRACVTNERTNERTNSHVREQEAKEEIVLEPSAENPDDIDAKLLDDMQRHQRAVNFFVEKYGKQGKPASIDQAFRDAVRYVMENKNLDERDARIHLCLKGESAYLSDDKNDIEKRYRSSPEKWLMERCYLNDFEVDVTKKNKRDIPKIDPYANFTPD